MSVYAMWDDVDPEHPFSAEVRARFPEECGDCGTDELCERCWVNVVKPRLDAMASCCDAPSPPPQPATTRLAAESDDADRRYVAQRERAERAEEEARALRAQVRALEEARGELLDDLDWLWNWGMALVGNRGVRS